MKKAVSIAKAYLRLSRPEIGDVITNLKLQKLLYYTQGFHLALYKEPIFRENLIAWEHGPVVREVYDYFKEHGAEAISAPEKAVVLTKNEKDLINSVWEIYGQFSAWKLREMTHNESPWRNTPRNSVISHENLSSFFKNQLVNGK